MSEPSRMLDGARPPTAAQVAGWIGARSFTFWTALTGFIEAQYPGVFQPDWWLGGQEECVSRVSRALYLRCRKTVVLSPGRSRAKAVAISLVGADIAFVSSEPG